MRDNTNSKMAALVVSDSDEDEMQREMLSCLCGRIFSIPCSLCCGHTMCRDCILKNDFVCTTCGKSSESSRDSISVNVLLHSIVAKLYPKHCEIEKLKLLAKKKEEVGENDCALEKLTLARSINPKDITVLNARSSLLTKQKRYSEARADAQSSVELDPTNGKSHFCLGAALSGLKLMDEAIESYQTCLEYAYENDELMQAVYNEMDHLLSAEIEAEPETSSPSQKRKRDSTDEGQQTGQHITNLSTKKLALGTLTKTAISLDDVRCSLCLEILFQPVTTSCGHSFCKSCLMRSLDYRAVCPHCRTPQSEIVSQQSVDVTQAIEKFLADHFPVQYSQLQSMYDERQTNLSRVGSDRAVPVPILVCMAAFPDIPSPMNIFEPKYRGMLRECLESGSNRFGACAPTKDGHSDIGTILKVVDVKYSMDGKAIINTIGENRFKIVNTTTREDGLMSAFVDYITDDWQKIDEKDIEKVKETCNNVYKKLCVYFNALKPDARECITRALGEMPSLEMKVTEHPNGIGWLWWAIAALPLHESLKIRFLKSTSFLDRIGSIDRYLQSLLKQASCN